MVHWSMRVILITVFVGEKQVVGGNASKEKRLHVVEKWSVLWFHWRDDGAGDQLDFLLSNKNARLKIFHKSFA